MAHRSALLQTHMPCQNEHRSREFHNAGLQRSFASGATRGLSPCPLAANFRGSLRTALSLGNYGDRITCHLICACIGAGRVGGAISYVGTKTRELARELETDDVEAAFNERLKELAKAAPKPKEEKPKR